LPLYGYRRAGVPLRFFGDLAMSLSTLSEQRKGIWLALACYGIWGLFPLFWYPLNHSAMPAEQILAQRIVWSSVFALALLLAFSQGRALVVAFRQPKVLAMFALSSLLIAANWLIYLWAIVHHHVVEASLGYFINPLFNVLLGFVLFKERLNAWQIAAIALALAGIAWLAVPAGQIPWISLFLAFSFGFYGAVRKLAPMPPLAGLTLETLMLLPFALGYLAWCGMQNTLVFGELTPLQKTVLFASGAATTLPLLAFAAAAKRITLSLLGILQNLSPTAQLLLGLAFGEQLSGARLIGYGLVWLGVLVFAGWAWYADVQTALWITVSLLVATCPCALSLATPAALAASTGHLAGEGVLISRGHSLETLARIDTVVLDKTGTLTTGQLAVCAVYTAEGISQDLAVSLAQLLERQSEHPAARAIANLPPATLALEAENYLNRAGHGISAQVRHEGQLEQWRIGRLDYVAELSGTLPESLQAEHTGGAVYLGSAAGFAAVFLLQDQAKPEVPAMLAEWKRQGLSLHLLSGDRQAAADAVAAALPLDAVRAEATPEDKLAYVQDLQAKGHKVLMVGDGINDAPVLAQADVSVAVAEGADVAREGADVLLLNGNMHTLPYLTTQAKRTAWIVADAWWGGAGTTAVGVAGRAAGFVTPWVAALGMSLSSLLVSANALRLLRRAK